MNTPVALIIFNRPKLARRVFERIRKARPPELLVISDGPRIGHHGDRARVEECRALIDQNVDWPCTVRCNYAGRNLGCRDRVRTGLDWVFDQVGQAIILEDDCLPDPSFFGFCEELLARYRDDERVMNIGGTNFIAPYFRPPASYWFSHHAWTWGWATWRRAWRHYDFDMDSWGERQPALRASFGSRWERQYWITTFDHARRNPREVDCWDFQWNYTCRSLGGLSILPRENLVENLGFDGGGTHQFGDAGRRLRLSAQSVGVLNHPQRIEASSYADDLWTRVYAGEPLGIVNNFKARIRVSRDLFSAQFPPDP